VVVTKICTEYTRFQCECGDYFDMGNEDHETFKEMEAHANECTTAWDDTEVPEAAEE